MVFGAKVCELTDVFVWCVCGLYVGILTSPLNESWISQLFNVSIGLKGVQNMFTKEYKYYHLFPSFFWDNSFNIGKRLLKCFVVLIEMLGGTVSQNVFILVTLKKHKVGQDISFMGQVRHTMIML